MLKVAQPSPGEDDDRLLTQAAAGDAAAFGCLVRQHEAMVFSLARRFLGDDSAAEDLAQEVFLALHQHLAGLRTAAHVKFWLRRVTANRGIDRRRRRSWQLERPVEHAREPAIAPVAPDFLLESRLRLLVDRLPARARIVVALRYQEDLEPSEIAALLGIPLNTVKSHLRRSLAALRAQLPAEAS
jgi:RNA polymerase sigma-70 factor (ECF subfamily)